MIDCRNILLKIISGHNGAVSTQDIYKALETGRYLNTHEMRSTPQYGGRPAYQHSIRSYLSKMVKDGSIEKVGRGEYKTVR